MQFKGLGVPNKYFAEQNGLCIYEDTAYNLCNSTEFRVLRVGGSIRVPKDSFDAWLNRAA